MSLFPVTFSTPELAAFRALAAHPKLTVLADLDGTLVEFAATPAQATLAPEVVRVLHRLMSDGVRVVVVSGRPRPAIEPLVAELPGLWWAAEHGAWTRFGDAWLGPDSVPPELDELEGTIAALALAPGARYERKSLSVCLHWRQVRPADRPALVAAAELACAEWLEAHPAFEQLAGVEMLEVRVAHAHKGTVVRRVRESIDGAHLLALGDDLTDEDMFAELGGDDRAIIVGHHARPTRAHAALSGPAAVRSFLCWMLDIRAGREAAPPPLVPVIEPQPRPDQRRLLVISNRMPSVVIGRKREVGGLVAALAPALADAQAIWLGWSGQEREGKTGPVIDTLATPARASFDLPPTLRERFYAGFCNRSLWPLLHGFPSRVRYDDAEWDAYVVANDLYAQHAVELVRPDGVVWVHDYHLLLTARAMRRRGHRGRIGLFLHVPVPPRDLIETIPWRTELLEALLDFDLIGLHTERSAENVLAAVQDLPDVTVERQLIRHRGRRCEIGVFPIAIDPAPFRFSTDESAEVAGLRAALGSRRLLLGVDRLDYAKGIPERLAGFERLLAQRPEWRGQVTLVQVSVPSRAEIPDYVELKARVEAMVGRINGLYGEADWVPVRYLYRAYDHDVLAQLYRLAEIALVTPLRDGMNLVAKEFVVAQDPARPGVLVLSQFAGAAHELEDALLCNPYHADGVAAEIDRALRMPNEERVARHARLLEAIARGGTAVTWAKGFLERLNGPCVGMAPISVANRSNALERPS